MKLYLHRKYKKDKYTIGKLYIDGKYFCDTLEDTDRGLRADMRADKILELKEYGNTAIPTGTYIIKRHYYTKMKQYVPQLLSVPGYIGILIHPGNTAKDTLGCILVGVNKEVGKVLDSRATFSKLWEILNPALLKGEAVTIEIGYEEPNN